MADRTLNPNEILLNSNRYKIIGHIRPRLASVFPGKVVTGDYSKESEQVSSSWIINDQRGGIGVEEMDEAKDANRSFWSTASVRFKGHATLPPLATEITLPTAPAFDTATGTGGWTLVSDPTVTGTGQNVTIALVNAGGVESATNALTGWSNDLRGSTITVVVTGASSGGAGTRQCIITDGVDTTTFNLLDGVNVIQHKLDEAATGISIKFEVNVGQITVSKIGWASTGTVGNFCNFNNNLYCTNGNILYRMDTTTGGDYHILAILPATITHLISSVGSCMYAFLGDSDYYYFMSNNGTLVNGTGKATGAPITLTFTQTITATVAGTFTVTLPTGGTGTATSGTATITGSPQTLAAGANTVTAEGTGTFTIVSYEAFTRTDSANAQLGVHWANKLYKINTSGQLAYAATPNAASPSWTGDALLPVTDTGTIHRIETGRDADNVVIIHVGTKGGLWAHDNTNTQFLGTDMTLPMHPNGSKGLCRWRDALYVSAGLDVFKYQPSQGAIRQIGVTKDDGIPIEHNGEIMALIRGHEAMYALVDAGQSTGTGYSSVIAYDDVGWHPIWTTSTADGSMHDGVVSSAYGYQLWFDHNGKVVTIPLHRSLGNPLKFSTDTYAASGMHITPWFDGNTVWYKTAHELKVYTSGCSATETVVVKYRIDHATTARDSTWTTLGTITTNGESSYAFASSAGVAFKAIQFRFDLARGGTTTSTPDVQSVSLSYTQNLTASYAWSMVLDLSDEQGYRGKAVANKISDIETIINGNVLVPFTFTHSTAKAAETHYVKVYSLSGEHSTGEDKTAIYNLVLIEP